MIVKFYIAHKENGWIEPNVFYCYSDAERYLEENYMKDYIIIPEIDR